MTFDLNFVEFAIPTFQSSDCRLPLKEDAMILLWVSVGIYCLEVGGMCGSLSKDVGVVGEI